MARLGRARPHRPVITKAITATATANTRTFTGSITSTGGVKKDTAVTRAGSTTATGLIVKAVAKILTGTSTASGSYSGSKNGGGTANTATHTGSITATGTIDKDVAITRVGSSTSTGRATKAVAFVRTGSITATGALTKLLTQVRTFTGSITGSGRATKAVTIRRLGSSTPSGLIVKVRSLVRTFTGSITGTGRATKAVSVTMRGSTQAFGLLTSPDFPEAVVGDEPIIRTYYPGTDTPTRLAFFDLDRLRREGDEALEERVAVIEADLAATPDDGTVLWQDSRVVYDGPLSISGAYDVHFGDPNVYPFPTTARFLVSGAYVYDDIAGLSQLMLYSNAQTDPGTGTGTIFDITSGVSNPASWWTAQYGTIQGSAPVAASGTFQWSVRFYNPGTFFYYRLNLLVQRIAG